MAFKNEAKKIVNFLLEDGIQKACALCEKEFGVHDPNASHGNCKRHQIAMYQELQRINRIDMSQQIAAVQAKPDAAFAPDLARPENATYKNSLTPVDPKKEAERQKQQADYMALHHANLTRGAGR